MLNYLSKEFRYTTFPPLRMTARSLIFEIILLKSCKRQAVNIPGQRNMETYSDGCVNMIKAMV